MDEVVRYWLDLGCYYDFKSVSIIDLRVIIQK
jgi:hypothetical protein